ncbi:MAG: nucleotidyltransferase family protein [Planctomycetes bacterium]|nr:nucleotidyltransferase family protein [Planctomycetota bacterium]
MRRAKIKEERPQLKGILRVLRSHLPELQKRYGVKSLGVFGSYVRGEQQRLSDVDILVEFERVPTLLGLAALQRDLGNLLGVKADIVMRSTLKPAIGQFILSEVVYV